MDRGIVAPAAAIIYEAPILPQTYDSECSGPQRGSELRSSSWTCLNSCLCRGAERGTARPEVLQAVLGTTQRVVQEIDSVE